MFGVFYQFALHLLALGSIPKLIFNWSKYRPYFSKRLGVDFPDIKKGSKKLIWIHAVSLGETKAVAGLIYHLKNNPDNIILLSTMTQTGHQEGKKNIPQADYHVFLPFDFSYLIKPIVKKVCPDVVIIVETDFWYNFHQAAKQCGAEIIVINGKLSSRSLKRYVKLPIAQQLLRSIDFFCVQNELYQKRFEQLGIASDKIKITGNLKIDSFKKMLSLQEKHHLKDLLGIRESDFVITIGSTHNPEEKLWIDAIKLLLGTYPHLKILIVPRHPERFSEVVDLLRTKNVSYKLFSENSNESKSVVLIDAMGVLLHCYQVSDLAFVGGSLTKKVGGHNILEPCFFGVPVLYGPYMHAQPDFSDLVDVYQSGQQIDRHNIVKAVAELINDQQKRQTLGRQGLKLTAQSNGATQKTLLVIEKLLR